MTRKNQRKSLPPSASAAVRGPFAAAGLMILSVMTASACSSSESSGSKVLGSGSASGGGASNDGSSSAGGSGSFFGDDGGFLHGQDSGRGNGADGACGETAVAAAPRTVNVLLVIDKSGSMADTPAGFSTDKWSALKSALGTALDATKNDIAFGLELFPMSSDPQNPIPIGCTTNCCDMPAPPGIGVPVESGPTAVPGILSALAATSPGGGTPTATALDRALDYFKTGGGAALPGDKYVLLATDGGPDCNPLLTCAAGRCTTNLDGECPLPAGGNDNCCDPMFGGAAAKSRCLDDGATTDAIAALRTEGVKTFVVGIPGTEAYATSLDGFAEAGGEVNPTGTAKYFAVSARGGAAGLAAVLMSITEQLITTCRLQLTSNPPDRTKLNVNVDGKLITQSGPDGWKLDTTTSPPTIVLEGKTCSDVETEGAQSVQIVYGCPTVTVQ